MFQKVTTYLDEKGIYCYKDSDVLELMRDANIKWCSFSLESGSQEIRKKLGKPTYTNEQIIEFFTIP